MTKLFLAAQTLGVLAVMTGVFLLAPIGVTLVIGGVVLVALGALKEADKI